MAFNRTGLTNDIDRVLFTEEQIAEKVRELGERITRDYAGKNPLLICILRGAVPFFADLCKCIGDYMEMDFMAISNYGDGMVNTGRNHISKDVSTDIEGRHVIIVEDIVDSGRTLDHLTRLLNTRNPASLKIACLLDKYKARAENISLTPEYYCFPVDNEFVVGYGLDYAGAYRNLPFIGVLKEEVYKDEQ
ncbi:MAG: hypoxanthine phosphoribosyltransferase [Clostridia bacterium]|nr:hypoxanthine phosphoribosyltransferase [Clostridia bacterium]